MFINNLLNKLKRNNRKFKAKARGRQLKNQAKIASAGYKNQRAAKPLGKMLAVLITLGLVIFILANAVPLAVSLLNFQLHREPNDGGKPVQAWSQNERLTILVVGLDEPDSEHAFVDALSVVIIDPDNNKVGIFNINPDLNVYVPVIGKNLNLRTLYNNKIVRKNDLDVLTKSVESLLALTIDRYAVISINDFKSLASSMSPVDVDINRDVRDNDTKFLTQGGQSVYFFRGNRLLLQQEFLPFLASDVNGKDDQLSRQVNFFKSLLKDNLNIANFPKFAQMLTAFSKNVRTNLSPWEALAIVKILFGLRDDQVVTGYTKLDATTRSAAKGFYQTYDPIIENIDAEVANIFFNINIFKEQAQIEVLNGSGIQGLAQNRARWITNSGGRVIHVGNSPEVEPVTKAYVTNIEKFPVTINELKKIFQGNIEVMESPFKYRYLGDIVVVLGQDNKL